jgi:tRNA threonylcarbamoyladenosine biosynthesis protein TsaB
VALILCIETATTVCSVSVGLDGRLLALKELNEPKVHASAITLFVEECMKTSGYGFKELHAVAVSKGPGSYTGLRIGVSAAKGFCYALGIPLIGISTLQAMAYGAAKQYQTAPEDLLCPMIDARRMEVYSAFYRQDNTILRDVQADILNETSYGDLLERQVVHFFGDGMPKSRPLLERFPNARFIEECYPSSEHLVPLAEEAYRNKSFEDTAYFEPFYLKDFVAGVKSPKP